MSLFDPTHCLKGVRFQQVKEVKYDRFSHVPFRVQLAPLREGFKGVLMNKVKVNGAGASPVFNFLKAKSKTGAVMWNFCKYLVDKEGQVVARFDPSKFPSDMIPMIQELTDRKQSPTDRT